MKIIKIVKGEIFDVLKKRRKDEIRQKRKQNYRKLEYLGKSKQSKYKYMYL